MKGKTLLWLVIWIIGTIYIVLLYPLLHKPESNPIEPGNLASGDATDSIQDQTSSTDIQTDQTKLEPWAIDNNTWEKKAKLCREEQCFTIEVADTPAQRQQGLMDREFLAADAGMLFVFQAPGFYGFWMKNTLISLDIIRLDTNFIVVDTATMQPCTQDPCPTYEPQWLASYALEIQAWLVERYEINPWDIFIQK